MNTIWHCSDFDQFNNFLPNVPGSRAWEVNEHTEALIAQTLYYQSKIITQSVAFPDETASPHDFHVISMPVSHGCSHCIESHNILQSLQIWAFAGIQIYTHRVFHSSQSCYCEFFSLLFPFSQSDGYIFSFNGPRLARNVNKQHKATTSTHNCEFYCTSNPGEYKFLDTFGHTKR